VVNCCGGGGVCGAKVGNVQRNKENGRKRERIERNREGQEGTLGGLFTGSQKFLKTNSILKEM
jgi:hypothetical protein